MSRSFLRIIALAGAIVFAAALAGCAGKPKYKPIVSTTGTQATTGESNGAASRESASGDTPGTPDTPDTPDTPTVPDTPNTPDTPTVPDTPDTPDTPTVPDTPDTPDTPTVPDTPDTPDTPTVPDTPDTPDTPTVPDTPDTPTVPDTPDTPDTPSIVVPPFDPLVFEDYQYEFKADLSAYEQYMNVRGEDYLILVNPDHPLPANYEPSDLVAAENTRADRGKLNSDGSIAVGLRLYAEKAMEALYKEAEACGMLYKQSVTKDDGKVSTNRLGITTAYRSYAVQRYLFNSYTERDMKLYPDKTRAEVEEIVATYSCRPGTSEHQTGLCADMHNWPTAGRYMADDFAKTEAGKWLIENCYKFGYILRFPKDKQDVTGITYESWHFRFVGRFHATRMHELNMCLEEYIAYLENATGREITGKL